MLQDHELLGIERDANPGEVRAAYIAALKRLHPDSSGSSVDAEKVSELVAAYRRLRDSANRRSRALAGDQLSLRATRRPYLVPLRPTTPVVLWGRALTLALLAGAILAAVLVTIPEPAPRRAIASTGPPPKSPVPTEWGEPDEAIVRQAVGALQSFGPQDGAEAVEAHSRRCFGELATSRDLKLLDYCLAFDLAASQTYAISREPPDGKQTFFHPVELRARHSAALRDLIGDNQTRRLRRSRIESQTVSALAAAVRVDDMDRVTLTGPAPERSSLSDRWPR
jgi:hypothetical protein